MATLPRENYAGTTLLVLTMTLISIGLIAISSASISLSEARFGDEWHHATRHLMYLGIGVTLGVAAYFIPVTVWRHTSPLAPPTGLRPAGGCSGAGCRTYR